MALFVSQRDSRAVPSISRKWSSSFRKQRTDNLDPVSNHNNFKITIWPRGMPMVHVQTEAGRVLFDWWFVEFGLLVSVKFPGKVRLMLPAGSWSRLTSPPQWWCDEANVLSVKRKHDAGKSCNLSAMEFLRCCTNQAKQLFTPSLRQYYRSHLSFEQHFQKAK